MSSMAAGAFAAKQISTLLERLVYEMHRCAKNPDPEAVHDLRVSIRRFNQGAKVLRGFLPARAIRKIRGKLKSVMDLAAIVRDRDIGLDLIGRAGLLDTLESSPRIKGERESAAHALAEELRRYTRHVHLARWRSLVKPASPPEDEGTAASFAARRLPRRSKKFFTTCRKAVDSKKGGDCLHQMRLLGKRFRYTLELFVPVYGPGLEEKIESMRKLQGFLGDVNDCRSTRALLETDPQTPGLKELQAYLARREARRIREFRAFWAQFDAEGELGRWQNYLERYAGRGRAAQG